MTHTDDNAICTEPSNAGRGSNRGPKEQVRPGPIRSFLRSAIQAINLRSSRHLLSYTLTFILVMIAVGFCWSNWNRCVQLISVNPYWLPIAALMLVSSLVTRAAFLKVLSQEQGVRITARECFCLIGATNMLGLLSLPAAGVAYRASYLRRCHGVGYAQFAYGMGLFAIVTTLTWCAIGIAGLVGSGLSSESVLATLLIVALLSTVALVAIVGIRRILHVVLSRRASYLGSHVDGQLETASWRRLGSAAAVVTLFYAITQIGGTYLIFRLFALSIEPMNAVSLVAFHQLSGMIGVTPGSIGVQEGVSAILSNALDIDVVETVLVLALIRTACLGMSVVIGMPCLWWLPAESPAPLQQHNDVAQSVLL